MNKVVEPVATATLEVLTECDRCEAPIYVGAKFFILNHDEADCSEYVCGKCCENNMTEAERVALADVLRNALQATNGSGS